MPDFLYRMMSRLAGNASSWLHVAGVQYIVVLKIQTGFAITIAQYIIISRTLDPDGMLETCSHVGPALGLREFFGGLDTYSFDSVLYKVRWP